MNVTSVSQIYIIFIHVKERGKKKVFNLFKKKERTPDHELADAVRDAANEYNKAVAAATRVGLSVYVYAESYLGSSRTYLINQKLIVSQVTRYALSRF